MLSIVRGEKINWLASKNLIGESVWYIVARVGRSKYSTYEFYCKMSPDEIIISYEMCFHR